jgi:alcohol dehydrogenase (NADP+)
VLLARGGKQVVLGINTGMVAGIAADSLTCGRSRVKGSGIGGIAATQEVVDLCARHGITPEIQLVGAHEVNRVCVALRQQQRRR